MIKEERDGIRIFAGNANPALAAKICDKLGVPISGSTVKHFADGEIDVQILDSIRGKDCYVVQSTCRPVNDNIMELLVMIDALRRASAGHITAVIPYYGYARADRKASPRVAITAKLIANLITTAGANRVITIDLHAAQIQGFFDIPVDHLYARPVILDYLRRRDLGNTVIVSPDVGNVKGALSFAKKLNIMDLVIIDKRRPCPNKAEIYNIIGDVKGKTCFILDDIVDTAGTLCQAAKAIKERGAKHIIAAASHAVLSDPALQRIEESPIEEMIFTDSIPLDASKSAKIKVLSVAELIAEAIKRNHEGLSISELFE